MSASENLPQSETQPGASAMPVQGWDPLVQAYRSLRTLLQIVLVSVLILTASVFVFLLREVGEARRQVKELTQFVANYEKNSVPHLRLFRDRLIEFAKHNPDFVPILSKYVHPTNYTNAAQVPGSPQTSQVPAPAPLPLISPPKP
ncbi:MAG: hypothetical protein HY735_27680 [Verrucomicrobia bacterium]|nr:hypothetical protein [Verrucomicrobiota bacterium]